MFLLPALTLTVCGSRDSTPIIGIDLGTTYSCVAIFRNGRAEVIANDFGNRITPSVVSFTQKTPTVGDLADRDKFRNPTNTIFSIKRLIGLRYSDETVQSAIPLLPYKVVNENDSPVVEVDFEGKRTRFSPIQISGMILEKMKSIAEDFLGMKIEHAVVTVPAYFSDSQRKATKLAGELAGLQVARTLNEPTAAAFAYGFREKVDKRLLVFDLGGGTFDVTVLRIKDGVFEVLSTRGDPHLGGDDFDARVVAFLVEEFREKTGRDARTNPRALAKLRQAAVEAKKALSQLREVPIDIENVMEEMDLAVVLTRPKFEELCFDLFNRTLDSVAEALERSGLRKGEIDDVVLVGGSTRIPAVRNLVRNFFDGKELSKAINPDEAVAMGAAIDGAVLGGNEDVGDLGLMDVNPLSVGIEADRGMMSVIIPRDTHLPTMKKRNYTTLEDNQTFLRVQVYEGERPLVKDNHLLARFNLTGIARAPRRVPRITVTFEKDLDGILKVTAEDTTVNVRKEITVYWDELSKEQREEMVQFAKKMRAQDAKLRRAKLAKNRFETYLRDVRAGVSVGRVSLTVGDRKRVTEIVRKWLKWVESHVEEEEEIYRQKLGEAIHELQPLIGDFPVPRDPNDKDQSQDGNAQKDEAKGREEDEAKGSEEDEANGREEGDIPEEKDNREPGDL